jgi:hypothetical protein
METVDAPRVLHQALRASAFENHSRLKEVADEHRSGGCRGASNRAGGNTQTIPRSDLRVVQVVGRA